MPELEDSKKGFVDSIYNQKLDKEEPTPGCYIKARHSLAFIQFCGFVNLLVIRSNVSIAIVAMVNATSSVIDDVNSTSSCPDRGGGPSTEVSSVRIVQWALIYMNICMFKLFPNEKINGLAEMTPFVFANGVFHWNSAEQGLFLGSYFYGYVASSIPGAWLSKRFGMKYTVSLMTFVASVLTACTPFLAYFNFELLIATRVVIGLLQGAVAPSVVGSWGVWGHPSERSKYISFTVSGSSAGTCLNLIVSGVIAEYLGWEAVFYITGGAGVILSAFWFFLVYDYPEHHPRISIQEKDFITQATGRVGRNQANEVKGGSSPPWKSLATSLPVWATCVALFASMWGNYSMMSMLPTYMATVLHFDLAESGFLSALPYVMKWLFTVVGGYATSLVQSKTNISTGVLRKINQTVSLLTNALFLVLAGYVGCDATVAVAFFCIAVGANALTTPGCVANTVDIAPRYGGIVFGISNTIGNITGFLAPQVIGIILLDSNSIEQWQKVFWMSAGVGVFGALFYLIFASGEEQEWAKVSSDNMDLPKQEKT